MIPGHTFLRGKTRIRFLVSPEHGRKFSLPMNSQSTEEKNVYVWPAWIYDDPKQGVQGQIQLIIESLKKDKFAETFAHFFHQHPNEAHQDLIVERIKPGRDFTPSYFTIEPAPTFEAHLPYDQSVVDELQGDYLLETVRAALLARETARVEFFEQIHLPIHYDTIDVTFS